MKKPNLSNSQKSALVALRNCSLSQQKIDRYTSNVTLGGIEYQRVTFDSLVKHGAISKIRANKTLNTPAHFILTDLGKEWSEKLPTDLTKKESISEWKAHVRSRGDYMSMQAALIAAGSKIRSATVFELMQLKGLLYKQPRTSSSEDIVYFRKLTEEGEQFGRNIPTYHPEETEAVYHPNKIPSLLKHLGLL